MSNQTLHPGTRHPLVSVVMATYSGDRLDHLCSAVDSILNQDYSNIEFLIVVDGPVDAERQSYLDGLSTAASRIRVLFHERNLGPAAARNTGILQAKGAYIAIMDADDLSHPSRITRQLLFLSQCDLDVVGCFMHLIDDEGRRIGNRTAPTDFRSVRRIAPFRCPLNSAAAFGKAGLFRTFLYDSRLRVSEDYDLWVRLLKHNYKLANSTDYLYSYRQSSESTTKRRGLVYAKSDFRVKMSAIAIARIYLKPLIFVFAIGSAAIRMLPAPLFNLVYSLRR